MTVRGLLLAGAIAAAATAVAPGRAEASVLELAKRACLGEPLPYGREVEAAAGERSILLSPGDPEYDQALPLLPAPLAGWSAGAPKIEVFSTNALGCGFSIAREDRSGERAVIVSLTFAAAVKELRDELARPKPDVAPPERLLELKGRRGYDRLQTADRNLVLVVGSMALAINGAATEAEKRALLDAADLDAIERFKF